MQLQTSGHTLTVSEFRNLQASGLARRDLDGRYYAVIHSIIRVVTLSGE